MKLTLDIPESFYQPEVLAGYEVSKKAKQLWAIELDLLHVTLEVFKKNGLRYFAMGGTLLGAARHQGFIPWDDDIDIIMPRQDYDILLKEGKNWFQPPYHFQTPCTENGFFRSHVQIRNASYLGYIPKDQYRPCCKGVFIDIFVLDVVPDQRFLRWMHVKFANLVRGIGVLAMDHGSENLKNKSAVIKAASGIAHPLVSRVGFGKWFLFYNRVLSAYRRLKTDHVAHLTISYHEGKCWERIDFEQTCLLPFHMLELVCPKEYVKVLEKQYGENVMECPKTPPQSAHGEIVFEEEGTDINE